MGFMDELKRLAHPYEDDEDELDEYEDGPDEEEEEEEEPKPARRAPRAEKAAPKTGSSGGGSYYGGTSRDSKIVGFNRPASETMQVFLVEPDNTDAENMLTIAKHLMDGHTVVMNMEKTDKVTMDHMLFFMGGVAFAKGGDLKRVAERTFIVMPDNVSIEGKLRDELENSGWMSDLHRSF